MLEGFRLEGCALYTPVLMYLRESKSALRSSGTVVQCEDPGVKVRRKLLTVGRQGLITRGQLYGLWYCQGFLMISEGCGGLKSKIVGNRWRGYWEGLKRQMRPLDSLKSRNQNIESWKKIGIGIIKAEV